MRSFRVLAVALPMIAAACGSDDPGDAAAVFPEQGFIGRKLTVEVTGDTTDWGAGSTVNFGNDVTVGAVTVVSPQALQVELTINTDAVPGKTDVTVTSGGDTFTLPQAFDLQAPVDVEFAGTLAQGSIATFTITNKDLLNPFDTTSTGDGFFEPLVFTNFNITAPAGVEFLVDNVTGDTATGVLTIDVDAAPGNFTIASGEAGAEVMTNGGAVDVTARAAMPLTAGTPATGTEGGAFESTLYEFTPGAAPSLVQLATQTDNTDAQAAFALLPASGKFSELLAFTNANVQILESQSSKFYLVYWDNTGTAGYQYTISANSTALTAQAEVEPNNTPQAAKAATFTTLVTAATLTDDTDQDWYKIPVAAGDIGKVVHVITAAGDPQTDTVVEVFSNAQGTATLGGESANNDFHENHISDPIPAGTTNVTVKISADQTGFFDPTHNAYIVAIFLEDAPAP